MYTQHILFVYYGDNFQVVNSGISTDYLVFHKWELFVRCSSSCKATLFERSAEKNCCTMGTHYMCISPYFSWSRRKFTRNREPNQYIYVLTTFFRSFFCALSFFLFFFGCLSFLVACSSQICVAHFVHLESPKPQPCFSHCDLVGDFLSSFLCSVQKNYMTSRINRILSLLP